MNGYSVASELIRDGSEQRLQLATGLARTPQGLVADATFFTGFVDRPDVTAAGLLAVADVAGSRYADVGLAQRIANLDPVVTASGDRLRFESFSACGGVHARFDLLRDGLGSSEVGFGTTNVDVNQALRTALARVGRAEPLHLAVGPDELRASTPAATHVERKVELPDRWVRGFAEVGTFLSALSVAGRLRGAEIGAFLAQLPRVAPPGPDVHVLPHPSTWRISSRPLRGSVPLAGVSRLRGADRVVRHAQHLTLLVHENGTTAWVFELPGARFTLVVSPGPFRGFSGEGTLLTYLTHSGAPEIGRHLLAVLGWAPRIDPDALATRTGLSQPDIRAGLAWLAASGRVGYDTEERSWFHRELPVDSDAVLSRNPRLTAAQRLVESGAVSTDSVPSRWVVVGSQGDRYTVDSAGDRLRCTCPWETERTGRRGPCKHVLAVLITLRDDT